MGNLKNIKAADFNLEESFEDDIFMEVNGGGTSSAEWGTNFTKYYNWAYCTNWKL